ncbi:MAG: branched-chain amino acid ABC transporter permease [Desulfobacteraceae bacterium]|nr:branched-chain amino acid ABC transporter permease [Desulfobacteraceae bacterium]MBC2751917.1 branched-chain amino acid ABC transporter permease [Desulfobacteraceae bacterium]
MKVSMKTYRKTTLSVIVIATLFLAMVPVLPLSKPYFFYMMFWITMASAFNIIYGFVGYLPFGYVMFYGVGTYVTAVLWSRLGVPLPLAILCSGAAGLVLSLAFAPTLRLKGIYFAIVNFASAMVLRIVVANLPEAWAGGSFGISLSGAYKPLASYYLMLALTVASVVVGLWLSHSRLGIALRCIRDDEAAAAVMGINVSMSRLKAWMLAAVIPSLAGGIEAWFTAIVDPDTSFNLMSTAKTIVYAMFGGLGTITGPIFGAVFMYGLDDFIWGRFPLLNLLVLGVTIIFLILFLPRGVVGSLIQRWPGLRKIIE